MTDPLERLARRVEADPYFLAYHLAEYARSEKLDEPGLGRALGCREEDLPALRLCRAPRPEPAGLQADVRQIAERFALDAAALLNAVAQARAVARLREGGAGSPGFLMAARDRHGEVPGPGNET